MTRRSLPVLLALFALTPLSPRVSAAAAFAAESGAHKVALLELYTSEGCSSCPPADTFVSRLAAAGYYPGKVIPLAFHVTYWDYIGWRDPYASSAWDRRQYAVAARQESHNVYTPQLVLDGRNLRGTGGLDERLQVPGAAAPAAHISIEGSTGAQAVAADITVQVEDPAQRRAAELYVALVESNLDSRVSAGENRGRTLHHDHVVRQLIGPLQLPAGQAHSHHAVSVGIPAAVRLANSSLVMFVQNRNDGSVLQALATALPAADAGM